MLADGAHMHHHIRGASAGSKPGWRRRHVWRGAWGCVWSRCVCGYSWRVIQLRRGPTEHEIEKRDANAQHEHTGNNPRAPAKAKLALLRFRRHGPSGASVRGAWVARVTHRWATTARLIAPESTALWRASPGARIAWGATPARRRIPIVAHRRTPAPHRAITRAVWRATTAAARVIPAAAAIGATSAPAPVIGAAASAVIPIIHIASGVA